MRMPLLATALALALFVSGCSVWPVNQDPDGVEYRQDANHILFALQAYHKRTGQFPPTLQALVPGDIAKLPDVPLLRYDPRNGSLFYRYIPTFPQLRWTWCQSVGDTTNWRCEEHVI